MIGKTISHYHVTGALGAGGMGEVYRATDTRLDRDVALKVLPAGALADEAARKRFRKEALALSKLNHSNIAVVHDFDTQDGIDFLVMEFVEGTTLAGRIVDGALSEKEAAKIGAQVAEALEEAHEQGVIHRDLKPGNVMVTPKGRAKVLDFGLAKLLKTEGPDVSTMSESSSTTVAGTLPYMSPEQLQSEPVDARTDLYALGVLLYETATGRRPFLEDTAPKLTDAILHHEPVTPRALNARVTPEFERIILKSLEKDPDERYQSAKEVAVDLRRLRGSTSDLGIARRHRRLWQKVEFSWTVAGVLAVAFALALWAPWRSSEPESVPPMRLSIEVAPGESLYTNRGPAAVLSPDGTRLAFVTTDGQGQQKLYVRSFDQLQATVLSGTERAANPFFSPDGKWIAFFAGGKLKKISVSGGAAVTLCDASNDRGGSWSEDGTIIFAPSNLTGLSRVSSAGGTPEAVTTLDREKGEHTHRWPQVLPGGKAVLFSAGISQERNIVAHSLETGEAKTVQQGGIYGRYLPTGHLAYVRQGTLFAAPFDLGRLEVTGPPASIVEDVQASQGAASAHFDFSQTGTLVYLTRERATDVVSIFWMDSEGKTEPLLNTPRDYQRIRFSPDGRRLTVNFSDGKNHDIWVYDLQRQALSRLTFNEGRDSVWTPDGRHVTFGSNRHGGAPNIYWKRADGGGESQRLTESSNSQHLNSWSPDGKVLVFTESNPLTAYDLWTLPMEEDGAGGLKPGKPAPFLITPFFKGGPSFSPDGRWVAYYTNESGRHEVYVRPFPGPGGKWQISTGGGRFPTWSPNGRELFYRTLGVSSRIMVVSYSVEGDSFHAGKPRLWSEGQFAGRGFHNFALHPDGKRFAVLKASEDTAAQEVTHVNLVTNWFDEVRRRVASAGGN